MIEEGIRLMVVGMGTVFAFLTLMVVVMEAMGRFFRSNPDLFPEPVPATRTAAIPAPSEDTAEIAAIVAAIAAHRARRS